MARTDPQVNIRLPADLKARLDEHAAKEGRSLTAEVVYRLELSFAAGQYRGAAEHGLDLAKQLAETVKGLQQQLKERDEAMQRMSAFIDTMGARMDELQKAVATPKKGKPKP
jgi:phage shock protein A